MSSKNYNNNLLTVRVPENVLNNIKSLMNDTGGTKTDVVVDMLQNSVPSLSIQERAKLPEISGLYVVYTSVNKMLYLGKADNLNQHWQTHNKYGEFLAIDLNCRVSWFRNDDSLEIESELVETFVKPSKIKDSVSHELPNNNVESFLPVYLKDRLIEYCESNNIIKKDDESNSKSYLGIGIVKILESFFNNDSSISFQSKGFVDDNNDLESIKSEMVEYVINNVSDIISERMVQINQSFNHAIDENIKPVKNSLEGLKKDFYDINFSEINERLDYIYKTLELKYIPENNRNINNVNDVVEVLINNDVVEPPEFENKDIDVDVDSRNDKKGLTATELAKSLKTSRKNVSYHIKQNNLIEWVKSKFNKVIKQNDDGLYYLIL